MSLWCWVHNRTVDAKDNSTLFMNRLGRESLSLQWSNMVFYSIGHSQLLLFILNSLFYYMSVIAIISMYITDRFSFFSVFSACIKALLGRTFHTFCPPFQSQNWIRSIFLMNICSTNSYIPLVEYHGKILVTVILKPDTLLLELALWALCQKMKALPISKCFSLKIDMKGETVTFYSFSSLIFLRQCSFVR